MSTRIVVLDEKYSHLYNKRVHGKFLSKEGVRSSLASPILSHPLFKDYMLKGHTMRVLSRPSF